MVIVSVSPFVSPETPSEHIRIAFAVLSSPMFNVAIEQCLSKLSRDAGLIVAVHPRFVEEITNAPDAINLVEQACIRQALALATSLGGKSPFYTKRLADEYMCIDGRRRPSCASEHWGLAHILIKGNFPRPPMENRQTVFFGVFEADAPTVEGNSIADRCLAMALVVSTPSLPDTASWFVCAECRRHEGDGVTLRACGACRRTRYCSRECQRADREKHVSNTCRHFPPVN